jgi:putative ABC transport system permease protein
MHLDHVRQAATYITIKYSGGHAGDIRKDAERAWNSIQPFEKCNFNLFSDTINNLYKDEKKVGTLAGVLSGLAVFVACLGLFGLAMFVTEQRRKEIGVRKVLGASVPEVTVTISKQFVIWIGFANLLAWPLAYLVLYKWFQNFAYHVQPAWWMFLGAGLITLFIAMATVGTQSIKAALANPIKSLRTD